MKIRSMEELLQRCEERGKSIGEVMLEFEVNKSDRNREEVLGRMKERLVKMKEAVDHGTVDRSAAPSDISGGDACRLGQYRKESRPLSGDFIADAMRLAFATSEHNARMGVIVATPTAGSAGVLPGCLFSLHDNAGYSFEKLVMGLMTASAVGYIVANRSFVSGAAGGCQAEVGSAVSMAAAAIVELRGGTPVQAVHAAAISLKSMLGLVCDPVAGLVEVPCIKRNAIGTAIAFSSADIAMAGVESRIPCDEVIDAMYDIGKNMPRTLRETALGGLAVTPTGQNVKDRLFNNREQQTCSSGSSNRREVET
ncbi:L-serine ammonia-lyase, iron-sulfur-dependent, subunit alpha [Paludifilum halophilum]|uniref:L-serine dehydratase n=1 Tax=Paludifilum halophilum TaxID=1642702 RepID=A0A235B9Z3_9BACL|nr:L-serine ammonia-lyase, iron-sulfur-dependent, subunit alpha [Paludifilum halophilum]OYD09114.1 L-serine ammonia-lyase, iron-sulfur-dependent, subunit alpha [Paludifilum halophilum]